MTSLHIFLQAITLGGIEGLTEFLPVSSTGHLIIFSDMMGFEDTSNSTFEVVIRRRHPRRLCRIFQRLWGVLIKFLTGDRAARRFVAAVLLAFIPGGVVPRRRCCTFS